MEINNIKPLSSKAMASILANGWMTVWEGAIRSGKTVASLIAWLSYIEQSPEKIFFMTGKTYGSLIRNTILGDFGLLELAHPYATMAKDESGSAIIKIMNKRIYLFGAADDSSYMRIKGLTAGGWYADEVATHPKSFIIEAMARTAVSSDRRIFWTLNPVMPSHYIYKDFTDTWEGLPGYARYHFTLDDNLAMTKERRDDLARQFHGRYYKSYILGLRVTAEGVVYDNFDRNKHLISQEEAARVYSGDMPLYISCDYGTVNPCVFLECAYYNEIVYVLRECRWDSRKMMRQKTDSEYVDDMCKFIGQPEEAQQMIIVDPSAASFILSLQARGFPVIKGKNEVLDGIRKVSSLIGSNRLKICESCKGLIREMELYSWDEHAAKVGEEKPLKTNDHGADALRYFVNTVLPQFDIY